MVDPNVPALAVTPYSMLKCLFVALLYRFLARFLYRLCLLCSLLF